MDNLTHSLVGLMLARTGLGKTTPHGTAMMVLAANAPDIDAVFWFSGTQTYLEWHRSYPHAIVFTPLVALLPMLLARVRFSWPSFVAALIGVLSHLLLDWTNAYGIPLALPFSWYRFRLDIANVFDVWIWAILLGSAVVMALARRAHIGDRRSWARASLSALLVFEGARWAAHARAIDLMSARLYEGAPPQRVTALPGAFNPLEWRGVVEGRDLTQRDLTQRGLTQCGLTQRGLTQCGLTQRGLTQRGLTQRGLTQRGLTQRGLMQRGLMQQGFAIILPVDVVNGAGPGRLYRTAPPIPAMDAALRTPPFQVFSHWSQLPFWKVTPVEEGLRLDLFDLRFGNPDRPSFTTVSAIVDRSGKVIRAGFGI